MKKMLCLVFIVSSLSAYSQTAMSRLDISLGDGQEYVMSYYPSDNPCAEREAELKETYKRKAMELPLLRAIGIGAFEEEVQDAIDWNVEGVYLSQKRIYAFFGGGKFQDFFHKMMMSQRVKDILFDLTADLVCDLCRIYPKDFKDSLIGRINDVKDMVADLARHHYEARKVNGWGEYPVLFVDGSMAQHESYDFKGTLIRRIIQKELTAAEMSDYLDKLLFKVKSVDVRKNPDVMKRVRVNAELSYLITAEGNYYVAEKTKVKLYPYGTGTYRQFDEMSKVQCIQDRNSHLYRISNGTLVSSPEEHWEDYSGSDSSGLLVIDDKGEILYRE